MRSSIIRSTYSCWFHHHGYLKNSLPLRRSVTVLSENRFESHDNDSKHDKNKDRNILEQLHDIPVGQLTPQHMSQAESYIYDNDGNHMGEKALERMISEVHHNPDIIVRNRDDKIRAWYHAVLRNNMNVTKVFEVFERMQERHITSPHLFPLPNRTTYHLLLQSLSMISSSQSLSYPEVCSIIEDTLQKMNYQNLVTTMTYNIVLNVHASYASRELIAPQNAEDTLLHMSSIEENEQNVEPNTSSFNTVLKAWSHSCIKSKKSAERAHDILNLQLRFESVHPDLISFFTVLHAHSKCCDSLEYYSDYVQPLYQDLQQQIPSTDQKEDMLKFWNQVLNLLVHLEKQTPSKDISKQIFFGEEAHYILNEILQQQYDILPNLQTVNTALQLFPSPLQFLQKFMNTENADTNKKAPLFINAQTIRIAISRISDLSEISSIWDELVQNNQLDNITLRSSTRQVEKLYNTFLEKCQYSKNKAERKDEITFARRVLQHWIQTHVSSQTSKKTIVKKEAWDVSYAYNVVLSLLSDQSDPQNISDAYNILLEMKDLHEQGVIAIGPSTTMCNLVLRTLAQTSSSNSTKTKIVMDQPVTNLAMELLQEMKATEKSRLNIKMRPDAITYSTIISIWNNFCHSRRKASLEVWSLYREMLNIENGTFTIDKVVFIQVMDILSQYGEGQKVEKVFEEMIHYGKKNNFTVTDSKSCNLVLKAYAHRRNGRDAAIKAQDALVRMISQFQSGEQHSIPSIVGFNTVINSWAKSEDPNALKQVETIIQLVEKLRSSPKKNSQEVDTTHLRPDSWTYAAFLHLLSRKRSTLESALQAQDIFNKIDTNVLNIFIVNSLLSCWAKSPHKDKARRAQQILQKTQDDYKFGKSNFGPDIISYNIVLNACAFTKGMTDKKKEALCIAFEVFEDVSKLSNEKIKMDELTYSTMMKACINLTDTEEERLNLIMPILQQCSHDDCIGNLVRKELDFAFSKEKRKSMIDSCIGDSKHK